MSDTAPIEVTIDDLAAALGEGVPLIDVREPDEYVEAHVPGALLLPLGELNARAGEIPQDRQVFVICASGGRSLTAATALNRAGWQAVSVAGGTNGWVASGRPFLTGMDQGTPDPST